MKCYRTKYKELNWKTPRMQRILILLMGNLNVSINNKHSIKIILVCWSKGLLTIILLPTKLSTVFGLQLWLRRLVEVKRAEAKRCCDTCDTSASKFLKINTWYSYIAQQGQKTSGVWGQQRSLEIMSHYVVQDYSDYG